MYCCSRLKRRSTTNTNDNGNVSNDDVVITISDVTQLKSYLSTLHPVLIEGPGNSDDRDATPIALRIVESLRKKIQDQSITKPILLINQGDSIRKDGRNCGIASIFQIVVKELNVKKCLVCLDNDQPWHSQNADRQDVIYETRYSQMVKAIREKDVDLSKRIEEEIDDRMKERNEIRLAQGEKEIEDWVRDFVLLQEMTKVAMKLICGGVTVAHTISTADMKPDSVTTFFEIGLKLNLINAEEDMIFYVAEE
eukprot:CAMPEP_0203649746 /NCGR_PEP_ID=MMETSP0088-20131115/22649_1 /ASSEMBLY_ACC=CAM_ASM_001087 /TAXON_ID=426623 /ORGANISM="Chaetoceros affinis, Strain CCMP159" /LENGTH=251 /DNA_ID=CAMNT_0050508255 /DNA_START=29 /DNA_END=784 /DNA_ORIENTATION=-